MPNLKHNQDTRKCVQIKSLFNQCKERSKVSMTISPCRVYKELLTKCQSGKKVVRTGP